MPGGQRQFGGLNECAGRERVLMALVPILISLEPEAIEQRLLIAIAAGIAEPFVQARLLQDRGCLTMVSHALEPLELSQGGTFLELDITPGHDKTGIRVLRCSPVAIAIDQPGDSRKGGYPVDSPHLSLSFMHMADGLVK